MKTLIYCGAHTGESLSKLCEHFDRVEAFEANPDLIVPLQTRLGYCSHVSVHNLALAESDGIVELNIYGNDAGSSSLCAINPDAVELIKDQWPTDHFDLKKTHQVVSVNLDHWLTMHKIETVDLLVTDLQGYDAAVLETVSRRLAEGLILKVQCEVDSDALPHYVNSPDNSISRILELFRSHGKWRQLSGPREPWSVDANHLQADLVFEWAP